MKILTEQCQTARVIHADGERHDLARGSAVILHAIAGVLLVACSGEAAPPAAPPTPSTTLEPPMSPSAPTPVPTPVAGACTLPTTPATTFEETAWRIFVAATCPTNDPSQPLAFQAWTEQTCLTSPSTPGCGNDGGPRKRQLHGSHLLTGGLAAKSKGKLAAAPPLASECSSMLTTANAPAALQPFVPANLAARPTFCEEVFTNAPEIAYIQAPAQGHTLLTLAGQAAYVASGQEIQFPKEAVEIKADWLPAASLATPFDCTNPPAGLYTERIGGSCYALVGVHISSKLYPNWLWATFEPQNTDTNPNRCNPALYNECNDPWGSNPPTSTGSATEQTPELAALMKAADLPPAFANYRLVGVQTDYVDEQTTPLGNSFVELNAQVLPQQASCITCHAYAQFNASTSPPTENPNFGAFPGTPPVGQPVNTQPPVPPGSWQAQDFSWLIGIFPPS